jgi:hypothetical protein
MPRLAKLQGLLDTLHQASQVPDMDEGYESAENVGASPSSQGTKAAADAARMPPPAARPPLRPANGPARPPQQGEVVFSANGERCYRPSLDSACDAMWVGSCSFLSWLHPNMYASAPCTAPHLYQRMAPALPSFTPHTQTLPSHSIRLTRAALHPAGRRRARPALDHRPPALGRGHACGRPVRRGAGPSSAARHRHIHGRGGPHDPAGRRPRAGQGGHAHGHGHGGRYVRVKGRVGVLLCKLAGLHCPPFPPLSMPCPGGFRPCAPCVRHRRQQPHGGQPHRPGGRRRQVPRRGEGVPPGVECDGSSLSPHCTLHSIGARETDQLAAHRTAWYHCTCLDWVWSYRIGGQVRRLLEADASDRAALLAEVTRPRRRTSCVVWGGSGSMPLELGLVCGLALPCLGSCAESLSKQARLQSLLARTLQAGWPILRGKLGFCWPAPGGGADGQGPAGRGGRGGGGRGHGAPARAAAVGLHSRGLRGGFGLATS